MTIPRKRARWRGWEARREAWRAARIAHLERAVAAEEARRARALADARGLGARLAMAIHCAAAGDWAAADRAAMR